MAGLQDIAPMVANRWVTSAVCAPMRAAAAAASQPAWPPPITMTSKPRIHGVLLRARLHPVKTSPHGQESDSGFARHGTESS